MDHIDFEPPGWSKTSFSQKILLFFRIEGLKWSEITRPKSKITVPDGPGPLWQTPGTMDLGGLDSPVVLRFRTVRGPSKTIRSKNHETRPS